MDFYIFTCTSQHCILGDQSSLSELPPSGRTYSRVLLVINLHYNERVFPVP